LNSKKMKRRHNKLTKINSKLKAVSDLLKTELPLAAGICVIAGELLALGHFPSISEAFLGFLTGFFISGSAMISNDYFDLNVDKINRPSRPLPSGRITINELKLLMGIFSDAGLAAAALLGAVQLILAAVLWVVGVLYNWKLKETGIPGNTMVSLSVAMTFIFGGAAVGCVFGGLVWTFGAMAFMFDLGEEIAGGAMDLEGDKQRHAKTLASIKGRKTALRVAACLFTVFVGLSFVPYLMEWLCISYLFLVVPTDFVVCYFAFKLLRSNTVNEGRTRIRQLYLTLVVFVVCFIISRIIW
jgi:geranylgeranylglycerol-phosphate geranylgeranyltransferase